MNLHNIMEEIVYEYLDDVLKEKNDICKCNQCKTDMACYALNKVKPMYVVSSRGIIHSENERRQNFQDEIDIFSIIIEAVDVVSKTKRHETDFEKENIDFRSNMKNDEDTSLRGKFFFNFPQIVGRILDSQTLSPLSEVDILLSFNNSTEPIKMFNNQWKNPLFIVPQMQGGFTFWPSPIVGEKEGIQKDFQLSIEIKKSGYELIHRYFEIRCISTNELTKVIKKGKIYRLDDIYLYPEGLGEEKLEI
jgi:competence protein ComFB